jgi:hypothetical protein
LTTPRCSRTPRDGPVPWSARSAEIARSSAKRRRSRPPCGHQAQLRGAEHRPTGSGQLNEAQSPGRGWGGRGLLLVADHRSTRGSDRSARPRTPTGDVGLRLRWMRATRRSAAASRCTNIRPALPGRRSRRPRSDKHSAAAGSQRSSCVGTVHEAASNRRVGSPDGVVRSANELRDVSIVRLVLSFHGDQTALRTAMASRATPATAVITYRLSAARSRLLLRPTRRLRHTRAENRCERWRVANSTTATTAAATTQPHEPQKSTR